MQADEKASERHLFESLNASGGAVAKAVKRGRIRDYELREVVGEGGMGSVYKAYHSRLRRYVALKLLPQLDRLHRPDTIARFDREMAAIGRLRHPNIVQATDAGDEAGVHYLALELVDGTDAARISKSIGQLSVANACEIIRQTALGLQHAHDSDLIHRDIKPSNLMVSTDGIVKITDMGLAMLNVPGELTTSGQVMGTLDYIAPEQIENARDVDGRADLYSLGCTLYHLLAGKAPFDLPQHDGLLQKLRAHESSEPIPISEYRTDVPDEVVRILDRLLAKKPQDRFATANELVEAITPHSVGSQIAKLVRRVGQITETDRSTDRIVAGEIDTSVARSSASLLNCERLDVEGVGQGTTQGSETQASKGAGSRGASAARRRVMVALFCVIGIVFAANAAPLIRIVTNKGVLVIENHDDVDVLIARGKTDPVTIRDKATDREYTLHVGDDYQLVIKEPSTGTEFTTKRFSIKRNKKTVFDARAEMAKAVASKSSDGEPAPIVAWGGAGAKVGLTKANVRDSDIALDTPRTPKNQETASLSQRQLLEWLLLNGTKSIKAYDDDGRVFKAYKVEEIPRFLEEPLKVELAFDISADHQPPIEKLVSHASRLDLDVILLFGSAPSASVVASIAAEEKFGNIRFEGKFDFESLASLPASSFQHARELRLRERLTDKVIPLVIRHFPNVELLNIVDANVDRISELSKLKSLRSLVVTNWLASKPTRDLEHLTSIEKMYLLFDSGLKTNPQVDLSHQPPNIKEFQVVNLTLTAENFEQLKSYRQLASLEMDCRGMVRKPSPLDQQALADFIQARPEVKINLPRVRDVSQSAADIAVSKTANMSQRQLAEWLLLHGVVRMFGSNDKKGQIPINSLALQRLTDDLSEMQDLELHVDATDEEPMRIEGVLAHASRLKNLKSLYVFGDAQPSLSALQAIAAEKKLVRTRFYGAFDFEHLAAMPEGAFGHVKNLLLRQPITDDVIRLINSRYPNLEQLNITRLKSDRIWELQELPLNYLVLGDALKGTPTRGIEQLSSVETLYLVFFDRMKTEPEVKFNHLPPNIKELVVYNLTLDTDHLADLKWYRGLKKIQQRYLPKFIRDTTPLTEAELAEFKKIRPDVTIVLNEPTP